MACDSSLTELYTRKLFLLIGVLKHRNRLLREVVNAPKLSRSKRGILTMPLMIKMTATILVDHEMGQADGLDDQCRSLSN